MTGHVKRGDVGLDTREWDGREWMDGWMDGNESRGWRTAKKVVQEM